MDAVGIYLNTLRETLSRFGVSAGYNVEIIGSVRERMISLLRCWTNDARRKAFLFAGREEGVHYTPKVSNPDIAPFVVMTVRNSLFETAVSVDFKKAGLQKYLSSAQIKEITSAAIEYFSNINFAEIELPDTADDYYVDIAEKYPCAFLALVAIANYDDLQLCYKTQEYKPYSLPKNIIESESEILSVSSRAVGIKHSGIDNRIDSGLYLQLQRIANDEMDVLYSDSLKAISRNFEKFMMVFEFVLTRGATIATVNYYFENGRVEKRERLIKPASESIDNRSNIIRLSELSRGHRQILETIKR